jgi:hypothetical protein
MGLCGAIRSYPKIRMQQFEHRTFNVERRMWKALAQRRRLRRVSLRLYYKWQNALFDVQRSMFDVRRSSFIELSGASQVPPSP